MARQTSTRRLITPKTTITKSRVFRSTVRPRAQMNARGQALYFYKIFPENTIPTKKWCTTHSPILKKLFEEDPEWQSTNNGRQAHFTDYSQQSPIKSFFRTKVDITTKIFLAKLLQRKIIETVPIEKELSTEEVIQKIETPRSEMAEPIEELEETELVDNETELVDNETELVDNETELVDNETELTREIITESRPDFYPPTVICISGNINPIISENQILFDKNASEKWFLKPSAGYGGSGLRVLSNPQNAKKFIRQRAQGFPQETLDRNPLKVLRPEYVLQRGIEPYLMQGFKFDMRVWVLFVFNQKTQFKTYLYNDAFLRVCSKLYQKDSLKPLINLTNLTYHHDQRSVISKTYTLKSREYYPEVYPKIYQAVKTIVEYLQVALAPGPYRGFEIMGFDFILDEALNPHLLEINRHVGYPVTARNKSVVNLVYQMMRETINLTIKPMINPNLAPELGGWDPLLEFTAEV